MKKLALLVVLASLFAVVSVAHADAFQYTQNFTTSGTFTVPYTGGATTTVTVEVWGGGGGGGGSATNNNRGGGGGGGGGYSRSEFTLAPGSIYSFNVGTGGSGVSAGFAGNGTASWFNSSTTLNASGGVGGLTGSASGGVVGTGGAGALATQGTGTFKTNGGNGGSGIVTGGSGSGGGGGAGGNQSNGTAGGNGAVGSGGSAGAGGVQKGGAGGAGIVADGNGNPGVVPGGGGAGAFCDTSCTAMTGGNGASGMVSITYNAIAVSVKDVLTNALITVGGNLTFNTLAGFSTNFTIVASQTTTVTNLPAGTYQVVIQATGYNTNYGLLTVNSNTSEATFYVDSSTTPRLFNIRNGFGQAVSNATITWTRSVAGSPVAYTQVVSDSTGFATVSLNPTIVYLVTGIDPSGTYLNYTGSVLPNQDITYIIQFEFVPDPGYITPGNNTFTQLRANFTNATKVINVSWEVISPTGDLQYFGLNTTYNGTVYRMNTSGVPGGGIAYVNISNVNLSRQNQINVTLFFKRSAFSEVSFTVPLAFFDAPTGNMSLTGGLFTPPTGPSTGWGRAILGMIILVVLVAATYKATNLYEPTVLVAIVVTGAFTLPSVAIFPLVPGIISVTLGCIGLIAAAVGRGR